MTGYTILRYVYDVPIPIERVIVFPMAAVPNLWGLWNIFFIASHQRTNLSIGIHGAILPLILAPLGILMTSLLDFTIPGFATHIFPVAAPVALIAYYLVWKYFVASLNQILGIA